MEGLLNYLRHHLCFEAPAFSGSWCHEPQLEIKPKYSHMGCRHLNCQAKQPPLEDLNLFLYLFETNKYKAKSLKICPHYNIAILLLHISLKEMKT